MPILPDLPADTARAPRTVRLFPAAAASAPGSEPLIQRKARLAPEPAYARPEGVARAAPPETFGGLGSPTAREHARKHFSHLHNAGSHAVNPSAPEPGSGARRPVERTAPIAAEADFLHPCVRAARAGCAGAAPLNVRHSLLTHHPPQTPKHPLAPSLPPHPSLFSAAMATCDERRRTASRRRAW